MARLLPFYRTGGLLSGGGGGGPLGDATVWPQVANWAALGTIAGPLRLNDIVGVNDLVPGYGTAQYDGTNWRLQQATFPTEADLLAFGGGGELIGGGAIAIVGAGDETDPAYYYTGSAWARMPDEVHYIWTDRIDWADLATIADPQIDDEALVTTLGTTASSARAQKHLNQWRLTEGNWATVADMTAWPVPGVQAVHNLAFARVKSAGGSASDAVPYVYQSGAWVRYAGLTAGFAWTLTETQLLEGTDPSGVGALKDGDYGTYTPANGATIVVRFKAACTAPGGPRPVWMIPEAYAGTPQVVAWLTGSEGGVLATTLAAQGWTVTTTGTGTVTLNSGYVRCTTPAGVSGSAQIATPTWLGSQRFCVQGLLQGSASGSDPYVGLLQLNNNDIQYTFMRGNLSGVFRHFTLSAAPAWTTVDSLNSLPNVGGVAGYNLPAPGSTPWFFQSIGRVLTSVNQSETVETRIDGELYGSMRRNLDAAVAASAMNLALFANGGGGGTTSTLDSKTLTVLTY